MLLNSHHFEKTHQSIEEIFMRRLAQQILDLLRKNAWKRPNVKARVRPTSRLLVEALEDRFMPATSVNQVLPAVLTGTAFIDHYSNGILEANDLRLPGATISLHGTDYKGKAVSASVVTDSNGLYKFLEINPGTYQLSISTNGKYVSGNAQSSVGSQGGTVSGSVVSTISIAQGQTLVGYNLAVEGLANLGLSLRQFLSTTIIVHGIPTFRGTSASLPPGNGITYTDGAAPPSILTAVGTGSLAGTVKDTNGNPLAHVQIGLTGVTGSGPNAGLPTFTTTTTDATGAYTFSKLAAGTYSINVISQPAGFRAGTPVIGNLDGYFNQNNLLAGIDVTTIAGTGYNFTEIPVTEPTVGGAAAMEAHLLDDTSGPGGTASDGITSDPTIAGKIVNVGTISSFTGSLDSGTAGKLATPNSDGSFLLNVAAIDKLAASGALADGTHSLLLKVVGSAGTTSADVSFTLKTTPPILPSVHLDTTSDPSQNGRPIQNNVTILGTTSPGATVNLIAQDTVQLVTISGSPTGGTFTLSLAGTASSAIAFNAAASVVQTAVAGLPSPTGSGTIGAANVMVTGAAGGPYTITFIGTLSGTSVAQLVASASALTGGTSPSVSVAAYSVPTVLASATANASGDFSFPQTLNPGPNDFTILAVDKAGNQSQAQATFVINRPPVAQNTTQVIAITGSPTGGTFTLSLAGTASTALAFNAAATAVQSAIAGLPSPLGSGTIGTANVSVTGGAGGPYTVTFIGNLAGTNVAQLVTTSSLTGGTSPAVTAIVTFHPLSTVTVTLPATSQNLDLMNSFTDPDYSNTILQFNTSLGPVSVQLLDGQDPKTVANFLDYIKSGKFNSSIFHRLASGFVLQGGGFTLAAAPTTIDPVITGAPVTGEAITPPAGGSNVRGTVAMALSSGPNTGTSQYFFNLVNNSSLLDGTSDGGPFTVFATITDGFSQRIVDNLSSQTTFDQSKAPGAAINTDQLVTINGSPTGGTFTLNLSGNVTTPLAYNATASAVGAALAALPSLTGTGTIGSANVQVTGGSGTYMIAFVGNLAATNVAQLTGFSNLTGGLSPSVTVVTQTPGSATNGALNQIPLTNYTGTKFPTDATASNFEVVNSINILRNTEFLTFQVTNNSNPAVVSATLDPTFNNRMTLNFLSAGTSSITVTAIDKSNKSFSETFSVTVNPAVTPQSPVVNAQNFDATVGSAVGTVVGTVQAKNPNPGDTSTYSIASGNTGSTFGINPSTGQITVASNTGLTAGTKFTLGVTVTDSTSTSATTTATMTITTVANTAPTIANQAFTGVLGTANGTVLGTVAATDSEGQVLTYAITAGNGAGAFSINSTTGQLSVAKSTALTATTALTVSVSDGNATPLTSSATVTINLTADQAPTINAQAFNVPQSSANNAVVGTVVASAAGVGQTLTYSITAGDTNTFQIDPNTGVITVKNNANLTSGSPFTLKVQVTDNNGTPLSSTNTITINATPANTQPVIAAQTLSTVDGSPNGTVVGTVVASDPDLGQTLTYAITAGNIGGTLQINPSTGQITVANNANLNIALYPTFALTVQVTDNGTPVLTNSATVTINLTANHPPTIAAQTFSVPHGSANNTVVGTVVATDQDPGQMATAYAITAGNTNGAFKIDPNTGQITVANNAALTAANTSFNLTVSVKDNDARPLFSSATVTINVI